MPDSSPVISIKNLNMVFFPGTADEVVALKDINLDIRPGEFISFIGPSGCGKSTLLRLVADLLTPSNGVVTVNGKNPREARLKREYGFVFQAPTLYEWRTIRRNVQLPLEIMGYSAAEQSARAQKMLDMVELGQFANRYPWQLSGGMQQRASIARALAFEPPLMLMDEPFGALDEFTRDRMNMELLRIWRQTNTTIVFVTHSIAEAVFLSNRVVVMTARPGKIKDVIEINLPQPRVFETREEPAYFDYVIKVRESLREAFIG